jgi:hypothetical protein
MWRGACVSVVVAVALLLAAGPAKAACRTYLDYGRIGPIAGHDQGGVLSRWDRHPWYEEYPAVNANHVLNGFELSLLGLRDLARLSPLAARLFRQGVRSLVWGIAVFDGGPTGSYYAAGRFGPVNDPYLAVHVQLTRALYRITHHKILRTYADRWEAALRSHGAT